MVDDGTGGVEGGVPLPQTTNEKICTSGGRPRPKKSSCIPSFMYHALASVHLFDIRSPFRKTYIVVVCSSLYKHGC